MIIFYKHLCFYSSHKLGFYHSTKNKKIKELLLKEALANYLSISSPNYLCFRYFIACSTLSLREPAIIKNFIPIF
ncbi:MAG: hypothetical protein A2Y98_00555 [Candidatus Portnoybacteria bacterium RBG_19FT_COMBO_36_7]|uniref:Uncharacterized protein n=1 Tax=Candidatus Portnoybacteria bacterium RBG_19FT_COMBO_36_7 TaxID=1801992 RepID=A0A1G2F8S6_9BACT|nr:MAG: hypothetical protein A2Y98_00555 [Candidatus Portnoybacteria bacterium RBG_19FT_COMBO_36_7]